MEPKRGGAKEGVARAVSRSDPYKESTLVLEAFWSLNVCKAKERTEFEIGGGNLEGFELVWTARES